MILTLQYEGKPLFDFEKKLAKFMKKEGWEFLNSGYLLPDEDCPEGVRDMEFEKKIARNSERGADMVTIEEVARKIEEEFGEEIILSNDEMIITEIFTLIRDHEGWGLSFERFTHPDVAANIMQDLLAEVGISNVTICENYESIFNNQGECLGVGYESDGFALYAGPSKIEGEESEDIGNSGEKMRKGGGPQLESRTGQAEKMQAELVSNDTSEGAK